MGFYDDLQGVARELLTEFKTGEVEYIAPGSAGGDPWDPTRPQGQAYPLPGAYVEGVALERVDGVNVLATDRMITAPAFGATPSPAGSVEIDGKAHSIVSATPTPSAGTVVYWEIIARA